jgi:hypothetical protein
VTIFDDPNREAIGLEPIWTGAGETVPEGDDELDAMTKDQLLDYAAANDIDVSAHWSKADIRAAIDGE